MTIDAIVEWSHLLALDYTGRLDLPPVESEEIGSFVYHTHTIRGLETWMGDMVLYCEAQQERLR
jgi:hypothetical protein